jgi:hypothetical protein
MKDLFAGAEVATLAASLRGARRSQGVRQVDEAARKRPSDLTRAADIGVSEKKLRGRSCT